MMRLCVAQKPNHRGAVGSDHERADRLWDSVQVNFHGLLLLLIRAAPRQATGFAPAQPGRCTVSLISLLHHALESAVQNTHQEGTKDTNNPERFPVEYPNSLRVLRAFVV